MPVACALFWMHADGQTHATWRALGMPNGVAHAKWYAQRDSEGRVLCMGPVTSQDPEMRKGGPSDVLGKYMAFLIIIALFCCRIKL
jgi:hypothetical protein